MPPDKRLIAGGPGPQFPPGFLWGAATSSYQIEGSPLADGAGPGIWHRFVHTPGRVKNGDTGDLACDHYRRWADDVALMRDLGLGGYRLSLAWSRILPDGVGRVNQAGLDFYHRLIDRLLESGIAPSVTLYHWDLPAALDVRGGWGSPQSVDWFAEFAEVAFRAFGDRVSMWSTINEPWVVADAGYLFGVNAPGHRDAAESVMVSHHLLLAHAAAVRIYRRGGWNGRIGLVVNLEPKYAASRRAVDLDAAARASAYNNRFHLDPVFFGRYPERMSDVFGDAWPAFDPAEVARIQEPIDFVGVNYYTRRVVRDDPDAAPLDWSPVKVPGAKLMSTGWEVFPVGLTRTLLWVRERYGTVPIYITENGGAFPDPARARGGRVHDPRRVACIRAHLLAVLDAIRQGVDVRGYFVWSLLDNFEWSSGYSLRFGIVHVDYATQRRTPKTSGAFYREVVRTHGASLAAPARKPRAGARKTPTARAAKKPTRGTGAAKHHARTKRRHR